MVLFVCKFPQKNKISRWGDIMCFCKKRSFNSYAILNISYPFTLFLQILILTINISSAMALSINSSKSIEGSASYISLDGGITKVPSTTGLLGLKLPDGRFYIPSRASDAALYPGAIVDNSTRTTPIEVPEGITFADLKIAIPRTNNDNYPKLLFKDFPKFGYIIDDDGDSINITSTPNEYLKVTWTEYGHFANDITEDVRNNINDKLDSCRGSYALSLMHNGTFRGTSLGIPGTILFSNIRLSPHTYYIAPRDSTNSPRACFARTPSFKPDKDTTGYTVGPGWVYQRGFKTQDINNSESNFPTTGADGLSFYLQFVNITPEQVIAANGVNVSPISGSNTVTLSLSVAQLLGKNVLSVKLNGPGHTSASIQPFVPTEFKLYSDASHHELLYSFKLERWYIKPASSSYYGSYDKAVTQCQSYNGYRIPRYSDVTNANEPNLGIEMIPGDSNHNYRRQLSFKDNNGNWIGGIKNEWGDEFSVVNNTQAYIWTEGGYKVHNSRGLITNGADIYNFILCVSP